MVSDFSLSAASKNLLKIVFVRIEGTLMHFILELLFYIIVEVIFHGIFRLIVKIFKFLKLLLFVFKR